MYKLELGSDLLYRQSFPTGKRALKMANFAYRKLMCRVSL